MPRRSEELGARVAARDIENGLENIVSVFEASLKALAIRRLMDEGKGSEEIEKIKKRKIRNRFQGYDGALEVCRELFNVNIGPVTDDREEKAFKTTLEKRHPITHNLGIVDRKYLEKVSDLGVEGKDVGLSEDEVVSAIDVMLRIIRRVQSELF